MKSRAYHKSNVIILLQRTKIHWQGSLEQEELVRLIKVDLIAEL